MSGAITRRPFRGATLPEPARKTAGTAGTPQRVRVRRHVGPANWRGRIMVQSVAKYIEHGDDCHRGAFPPVAADVLV